MGVVMWAWLTVHYNNGGSLVSSSDPNQFPLHCEAQYTIVTIGDYLLCDLERERERERERGREGGREGTVTIPTTKLKLQYKLLTRQIYLTTDISISQY